MSPHAKGLALAIVGIAVLSPDALMLRVIMQTIDAWGIIAARSILIALVIGGIAMIFRRGRLFAAGGFAPSLAYGICFAVGAIGFPLAIQSTFGANALVILSISPLLSAVGARILLGEKIAKATWIASFFAVFGVGFIFADGFGSGRLQGDLFALATAFSIAGGSIVARRHRNLDTIPGIAIGGAIAAAVCIPFADFSGALELSPQVLLLALNGALIMPTAFALVNLASRLLPPPEVGLVFLLEMGLGPLWLWLAVSEIPPPTTIAAGALMTIIFIAHTFIVTRNQK